MPQFPHLSMKGEREWQRIISYTLSILTMTKSHSYKGAPLMLCGFLCLKYGDSYLPSLLKEL